MILGLKISVILIYQRKAQIKRKQFKLLSQYLFWVENKHSKNTRQISDNSLSSLCFSAWLITAVGTNLNPLNSWTNQSVDRCHCFRILFLEPCWVCDQDLERRCKKGATGVVGVWGRIARWCAMVRGMSIAADHETGRQQRDLRLVPARCNMV